MQTHYTLAPGPIPRSPPWLGMRGAFGGAGGRAGPPHPACGFGASQCHGVGQQILTTPALRSCPCPDSQQPEPYLQSCTGHIQRSWIGPQPHNEITKFILVEKDTNKKDLKPPRSLAVSQSTQLVGELLKLLGLFSFRRGAGAAASCVPVH